MSELIFPSQLAELYSVDWTNPDTDNLLTCQYDDGATVTNCITGENGEVFDSANELGTNTGISATWSTSKPVGIDDNPLSLLQTQNDVQSEYCLSFETASHQLTITFNGAYDIDVEHSDNTVTNYTGSGTFTLDGTTPVKITSIKGNDLDGYHYFSLNKTQDDTVQSETSSLVATLVNFPLDSGYVRGDNGEIVGYQFDGVAAATLTLTGAYSGILTYSDDSTLAIVGSGDLVVNSGLIKNVTVTDTLADYNYDFTTGDSAKIINTAPFYGNYVIENGEIVGYEAKGDNLVVLDTTAWKPNKVRYTIYLTYNENTTGSIFNPYSYNGESRGFSIYSNTQLKAYYGEEEYKYTYLNLPETLVFGQEYKFTFEMEDDIGLMRLFVDDVQAGSDYQSVRTSFPKKDWTVFSGYSHTKTGGGYIHQFSRIILEDMESTLPTIDLDFTTGDFNTITDTVGNNNASIEGVIPVNDTHATITNASTVKWQPVVEKQVYYIKSDGSRDYSDINTAVADQYLSNHRPIFNVSGEVASGGLSASYTNSRGDYEYGFEIHGDLAFDGDISNKATIIFNSASDIWNIRKNSPNINFKFQDVVLKATYENAEFIFPSTTIANLSFNRVAMTGIGGTSGTKEFLKTNNASSIIEINNSLFEGCSGGVIEVPSGTCNINNSIIRNNNTSNGGSNRGLLGGGVTAINCIFNNNLRGNVDVNVIDEYCMGDDTTLTGTNSLNNQPVATYFDANGQINQTGQTALKGKGWNGSDIASWAYALADSVDPPTDDYTITPVLSGGGVLNGSFLTAKDIGSITLSGNGSLSISPVIGRMIQTAVTGGGSIDNLVGIIKTVTSILTESPNIATAMGVSKEAVSQLSTEGNFASTIEFAKLVASIISENGSIQTSIDVSQEVTEGIVLALNGGGSILTSISSQRDVTVRKTMSIQLFNALRTYIKSGKFVQVTATTNGTFNSSVAKAISRALNTTTSPSITSSVLIDKSVTSAITTETHILIDTLKNTSVVSTISGDADIVTSVQIDRTTGSLILTAGGTVSTILLKDFDDSNIHYITMTTTANETTYTISSVSEEIYKEIEINART